MKSSAWVVWALGLSQIIGYGSLYYSFGVLAPDMALDFGWPEQWIFAALSGSLLVGGLVAPISGRWADRFGAGQLMAWGSVAAAAALVICALAPHVVIFVAGLVALEIASAFVLYSTAFAALAQLEPGSAQRRITYLTLIAGFASTIFWPLTSFLNELMSWREVYLVFAGLNLLLALPIHLWIARRGRLLRARLATGSLAPVPLVQPADEGRVLALMLFGFAVIGFVSSAILVHMLPMLGALGLGASAVLVTTLFGPAQVLSRLVNMQFGKGLSQPALGVIGALCLPLGVVALAVTAPWPPGAALFAITFGLGSGLSSIVSGALPLALFGTTGYGQKLGWISSARLVASSLAPFAFAFMVGISSTHVSLWLLVLIGLSGAASFAAIWWRYRQRPALGTISP